MWLQRVGAENNPPLMLVFGCESCHRGTESFPVGEARSKIVLCFVQWRCGKGATNADKGLNRAPEQGTPLVQIV